MDAESSQGARAGADIAVDMETASMRSLIPGIIPSVPGEGARRSRRMSMFPSLVSYPTKSLPASPVLDTRSFGKIEAISSAMDEVFGVLRRVAPTDVTVTLIGETGTGKDVVANAVHQASVRASGPFIVFDCGAVPANLVESELFGHERGAFTGAHAEHEGAFERARGGTLFLDEIGELPLDLQPRLLRALDSRTVRRVGGTRDRQTDVRIVAATNRDLAGLVEAKQFRQDLYFRLAAAVVHLPPLRDRLDDLPLLVPQLLADLGRSHLDIYVPESTYERLRVHRWPGNVRELKNVLAYALAFADGGILEAGTLRFAPSAVGVSPLERLPLGGQTLATLEQVAIKQTLALTRGNKVQTARMLGIASSTLYEKLKRYGL
jgi:two-component system, NtrC family, response regulator GlrR